MCPLTRASHFGISVFWLPQPFGVPGPGLRFPDSQSWTSATPGARTCPRAAGRPARRRLLFFFVFVFFFCTPTVDGYEIRFAPRNETMVETISLGGIYRGIES